MVRQKQKKKPSILFINRGYPPEAAPTGRLVQELAEYCDGRDWRISVLSLTPDPKAAKKAHKAQNKNSTIKLYPVKHKGDCRTQGDIMSGLFKILMKGLMIKNHDLVVTLTDPPMLCVCGGLISRFKGSKHIHWVQDLYPDLLPVLGVEMGKSKMKFFKSLSRRAMKKAHQVVAIGRCMEKYLKHTGVDPWSLKIIPNWASLSLFETVKIRAPQKDKKSEDTHNKQSDPKFRILYAGNIGRAHDMESILKTMRALAKTNPEIEFVFVGSGKGHRYVKKQTQKMRLKNARFLPHQSENKLKDLLEKGDVHLVSMRNDALGLLVPSKFYSILAVKRPVIFIGPKECENALVIKEHKAGISIPPSDEKALIKAILEFRNNPDFWFTAQKGSESAREVYNPAKSLIEWERLFEKVTKK